MQKKKLTDLRHITVARDGRQKKYRIRFRKFYAAFERLEIAQHVRDIEVRLINHAW
jgi:hypothetical protein